MKRNEKKAVNRNKIIVAAYSLMLHNGFQKTSVRDVSRESGISLVTMYKYFPSKDELVHAVILQMVRESIVHSQDVLEDDSLDFIEKFRQYTADSAKLRANISQAELDEISKIINSSSEIQEKIQKWQDDLGEKLINYGRKTGEIRTSVSDEAIKTFAIMLSQYVTNAPSGTMNEELISQLESLFLFGLAGDRKSES
ncbi:TetR/AcrR family transcriptional regulator [Furfurilactobacillus milii]|uniref:TetR family transcriptional regulator n=1 Tax=Furfurilactobacillus milii TaxID=2888272 RepID=A0A6N9I2K7_9LACO|nr:TetR/AcrR family transcriptional regulator [Furfurilactobacillus milii]MYV17180.1 TetR family transcriptional regulator [Furfurilactobacillus milii]